MQAARWQKVADLFEELTTTPPGQREIVLRRIRGGDPALHAEVLSLLQAHDQTSGLLDVPPEFSVDSDEPGAAAEVAGTLVGPYRLLRQIGQGGMGSVWLAERSDGVLKRNVALKRPHISWIGLPEDRMTEERDILASLEHPNIARLYDAGVSGDGYPYLALEYVEGVPITTYCTDQRLTVRQRLQLFLQVLDALQFAHARLVIHRDIKPSNILVSADGRTHLLDFGIARMLNRDDAGTQIVAALTPDYASPEQIRGEPIATTSDIYSLGIVLFELLAGARPYRLQGVRGPQLAHAIDTVAFGAPSAVAPGRTLQREIAGDLDAIVAKALQRIPANRYPSADAFAQDINHYLNGDPVAAHPDGFAYRLRKGIARYRWQTASAALAALALVAGSTVALWQAHVARQQAARAEQVKAFTLSLLDSADFDSGTGISTTAVDLLQAAQTRVERELAGMPDVSSELMTAIAYGLLGQDRAEEAATLLKRSIALSSRVNGPDDVRTIEAQVIYGEALYDLGKIDEAIAVLKPATIRARAAQDVHAESDAWRWLSSAQLDAGDNEAAVASARAAVAVIPPLLASSRRDALLDAAQAHAGLANILLGAMLPGVADEARMALKYTEWMGPARPPGVVIDSRTLLGMGLVDEGQLSQGLAEIQRAYADSRELRGDDHRQTGIIANLLGKTCIDAGDVACALASFEASYASVMRQQAALGPFAVAMAHFGLGSALNSAGRYDQALPHFSDAAGLFAEVGGPAAPRALRSRSVHAYTQMRLGRFAVADKEFASLSDAPFDATEKALHDGRLAQLRSLQGRHDEAVRLARSSADGMASVPVKSRRAKSLTTLGAVTVAAGQARDAVAPLEQAVALYRDSQVPGSPELAEAVAVLVQARAATAR